MIRDGLAGNVKGHLINSTAQVDEGLHPYVSLMEALESIFSCMNYESCLLTAILFFKFLTRTAEMFGGNLIHQELQYN